MNEGTETQARLVLSVEEVQKALGISRPSAYSLAHRIGVRIGKRLVVPTARVEQFLDGKGDD